ncbi:transcriptional regulator, TetR family [Dyadobacter sp. SG02]|uniref:TetR/AcrR family transcriptional regulator n=1 Tax=Dyadobacter sp. SG02 TaxID=1855291 RepID=UPI0008CC2255|nr:TetR/AcrR family transcriptional regulator [Dyadobacter sp. SG02]SEJ49876.1 transcriptional regulator, TetR family [Dyadobacter sp. SG02]
MRGRPSSIDHKQVLLKAQRVFWEKGFGATSLDDLLKATDMGSGSFYNTFKGGKKELFSKAIGQRREAFREFKAQLDRSESPVKEIKDFFRSIADADHDTHMRGCIIANAVTEMTFLDAELEAEAAAILEEVEQMFADAIRKEQLAGTIANPTAPELLGRYLVTVWNGMNVTRRIHPDRTSLRELIEMQLSVIS